MTNNPYQNLRINTNVELWKEQNEIEIEELHLHVVTVKRTKHSIENECISILMMRSNLFCNHDKHKQQTIPR